MNATSATAVVLGMYSQRKKRKKKMSKESGIRKTDVIAFVLIFLAMIGSLSYL